MEQENKQEEYDVFKITERKLIALIPKSKANDVADIISKSEKYVNTYSRNDLPIFYLKNGWIYFDRIDNKNGYCVMGNNCNPSLIKSFRKEILPVR